MFYPIHTSRSTPQHPAGPYHALLDQITENQLAPDSFWSCPLPPHIGNSSRKL